MTDKQKFLVFLSMFDYSSSKVQQIIDFMGEDLSIKRFCKTKFTKEVLSEENFAKMLVKADEQLVENYYHNLQNENIILLTKFDDNYPSKLRYLPDAPFYLFCMGDLSLFEKQGLSVVGTRKPTNYGRMATEKIVRDVAVRGVTIISGLAYGIDSISHRKCLEVGGKTIAVLGGGFHKIYPAEHKGLAEEIIKKGLLVSEYSPDKTATSYTFPLRNRIIAGLGDGVLITEASFKSGTIHTKDYALDYGKNIYSVPGSIESELSTLTNEIIKTGQASLVTCADDILKDYDISVDDKTKNCQKGMIEQLSIDEQFIVNLLQDGMKDIDYLTKNCKLNVKTFNTCLTTLEISGIISRLPGGYISLN